MNSEIVTPPGGLQFASALFAEFGEKWRFKHTLSIPYHSQSNRKEQSAVKEEEPQMTPLENRNPPSADIELSLAWKKHEDKNSAS